VTLYEGFKPMLAFNKTPDLATLRYPLLASTKIDGIRVITTDLGPVTRKLLPVPNKHIHAMLSRLPPGLDGEVTVGNVTDPNLCNITQSALMSVEGTPEFMFHVFDTVQLGYGFKDRQQLVKQIFRFPVLARATHFTSPLPHIWCHDPEGLAHFEQQCVGEGFEGVMVRDPHGPYKYGRSTLNEGYLIKIKRWKDDEATIIDTVELNVNGNEQKRDELGHAKRSKAKAGLVAGNTLGALVCGWKVDGEDVRFEIGSGFSRKQRVELWARRDEIIGQKVTLKFFGYTEENKPRFPIFKMIRDPRT
jgi:DNA ligase-1